MCASQSGVQELQVYVKDARRNGYPPPLTVYFILTVSRGSAFRTLLAQKTASNGESLASYSSSPSDRLSLSAIMPSTVNMRTSRLRRKPQ